MTRIWGLLLAVLVLLSSMASAWQDTGAPDSLTLGSCQHIPPDTLVFAIRFFSDNTGPNRIIAFLLPLLVTLSDSDLVWVDTTTATVFEGSMFSHFSRKSVTTDSCCGGNTDPSRSPVHLVIAALTFTGEGVTGDSLMATLKIAHRGGSDPLVCIDTLTVNGLGPEVVTESVHSYIPVWSRGYCYNLECPITGIADEGENTGSIDFLLPGNFPNPFNGSTTIQFYLPRSGQVRMEVIDVIGRRIKILLDERIQAGITRVVWDGSNEQGDQVASGIYFYRIKAEGFGTTRKMVLVK